MLLSKEKVLLQADPLTCWVRVTTVTVNCYCTNTHHLRGLEVYHVLYIHCIDMLLLLLKNNAPSSHQALETRKEIRIP